MENTKVILKVQFKSKLPDQKLAALSEEEKPILTEVPGMICKYYHFNPETGYLGAVYHFENETVADAYLHSPVIRNLEYRYGVVPGTFHVEKVKVFFALPGNNTSTNNMKIVGREWKTIATEKDFQDMMEASNSKTVFVFKNSNRCPVSRSILRKIDDCLVKNDQSKTEYYLIDVLSHRELSDLMATTFAVKHGSPQALVIKNRSCLAHYNKLEIDCNHITEHLDLVTRKKREENFSMADL